MPLTNDSNWALKASQSELKVVFFPEIVDCVVELWGGGVHGCVGLAPKGSDLLDSPPHQPRVVVAEMLFCFSPGVRLGFPD